MGKSDSKIGVIAGYAAAILFIAVAFMMVLMKDSGESGTLSSTNAIVLAIAGIVAVIAAILLIVRGARTIEKVSYVMILIMGAFAVASYVLIDGTKFTSTMFFQLFGSLAFAAMLIGAAACGSKGLKGVMAINVLFAFVEIVMVMLLSMGMYVSIATAAIALVLGFWILAAASFTGGEPEPKHEIDPNRKSAKRAMKQQEKADEEAKKEQEREEKLARIAKEREKEEAKAAKEEAKKEAPTAVAAKEEAPAEEKKENDFMSKLVSSKDAGKAAEEAKAAPADGAAAAASYDSAAAGAAGAAAGVAVAAAVADDDDDDEDDDFDDDEILEDTFTDYSPEALVRRAAWNKGLRCRRDYGDYHVPVAFVKGKVAVYVEEPGSADTKAEEALKKDGWVILRFDINKVTDGLDEGAQIADAVKANIRAIKAAKKKKKSVKK